LILRVLYFKVLYWVLFILF